MDVQHNFLSVITLGSFNPAILTLDFLKDHGIWTIDEHPQGTSTPVVSKLTFGDISFSAELERFQVIHHRVKDFQKSPIVDAACKYLEILKYTPLLIQGINFNVNLIKYEDSSGIRTIFEDPIMGMAKYTENIEEYQIDTKANVTNDKRETLAINCKYYIDDGVSVSINLKRLNGEIVLNFNQEVENIRADKNRIRLICDNYHNISKRFITLLEAIKE